MAARTSTEADRAGTPIHAKVDTRRWTSCWRALGRAACTLSAAERSVYEGDHPIPIQPPAGSDRGRRLMGREVHRWERVRSVHLVEELLRLDEKPPVAVLEGTKQDGAGEAGLP